MGVVLDYVGGIATQQRLLRQANLLKADAVPSANMPMHDLESVLELLDRPAMIFHYLRRRAEIESTTEIMADEQGFLALYLATGFDMGDMEGNPVHRFALPALSAKLEPYFMGREKGEPVVKPQMKLRPWWRQMLDQFEKRKFPGWLDTSAILLGTNYSGQENFEKGCTKLRRIVRSNWHRTHDDTCIGVYGPKHDRKGLVCLAIKNKEREAARDTLGVRVRQAIEQHGAQRILGLVIAAEKMVDPYLGVYFYEDPANPPTHRPT